MHFRMTRRQLLGGLPGLLGGCAAALLGRWPDSSKGTTAAGPRSRSEWLPGSVTTYTYDAQGHLIHKSATVPTLCLATSVYDGLGRLVSMSYGEVIQPVSYEAGPDRTRG